jgi:hypothetical protein
MRARLWVTIAAVATVVGAAVVVFAPLYGECSSDGTTTRCGEASGLRVNGSWIIVVASVPVLITLVPLLIPRRVVRVIAAVLLWVSCVIALFSVGIFFVPAAIALTIAAALPDPDPAPVS